MLRLFDITEITESYINLKTSQISGGDRVTYVVYDTSTGISAASIEDYIGWRCSTITSTGETVESVIFQINNNNKYPTYISSIPNYSLLRPGKLKVLSFVEYIILQQVITRLDLVRRRLPNPGFGVNTTNSVGQNGLVSFAGGYEKKFSVDELMQMIDGAIIEVNWTSPMTAFFPLYLTVQEESNPNLYSLNSGIPYEMVDIVVQGAVLRALVAWGLMEIDLSFSASESGLQITFDRVSHVQSWYGTLLQEYVRQMSTFKLNYANFYGVGVGTVPWSAFGTILGVGFNNVTYGGSMAISSVTGWSIRGNVPM